eukprot:997853_1
MASSLVVISSLIFTAHSQGSLTNQNPKMIYNPECMNWDNAQAWCVNWSTRATLASLTTQAERDYVVNTLIDESPKGSCSSWPASGYGIWAGGMNDGSSKTTFATTSQVWPDGTTTPFTEIDWDTNEPNNYLNGMDEGIGIHYPNLKFHTVYVKTSMLAVVCTINSIAATVVQTTTAEPTKPSQTPTTTAGPTRSPTTPGPTKNPHANADPHGTEAPTPSPTKKPTDTPTTKPTAVPTTHPTSKPTTNPSSTPTKYPTTSTTTKHPTSNPTRIPTSNPTRIPSSNPSKRPSSVPTHTPSSASPTSDTDTRTPSYPPSMNPTVHPTDTPTRKPSDNPTGSPTGIPSKTPTDTPSETPTDTSTRIPTPVDATSPPDPTPTDPPSGNPAVRPTLQPSTIPTARPSKYPTDTQTDPPSHRPTPSPSVSPSMKPTVHPSAAPSPTYYVAVIPTTKRPSSPYGEGEVTDDHFVSTSESSDQSSLDDAERQKLEERVKTIVLIALAAVVSAAFVLICVKQTKKRKRKRQRQTSEKVFSNSMSLEKDELQKRMDNPGTHWSTNPILMLPKLGASPLSTSIKKVGQELDKAHHPHLPRAISTTVPPGASFVALNMSNPIGQQYSGSMVVHHANTMSIDSNAKTHNSNAMSIDTNATGAMSMDGGFVTGAPDKQIGEQSESHHSHKDTNLALEGVFGDPNSQMIQMVDAGSRKNLVQQTNGAMVAMPVLNEHVEMNAYGDDVVSGSDSMPKGNTMKEEAALPSSYSTVNGGNVALMEFDDGQDALPQRAQTYGNYETVGSYSKASYRTGNGYL